MTTKTGVFSTKTEKSEKLLIFFGQYPKYPLTYFWGSCKLSTNSIAIRFFTVCFGKRIAIILLKPLKTRNMTMKNLVMRVVGLFVVLWANCQMLKWVKRGGGDRL
jgi:Na+-driven multidrug efflux pump